MSQSSKNIRNFTIGEKLGKTVLGKFTVFCDVYECLIGISQMYAYFKQDFGRSPPKNNCKFS